MPLMPERVKYRKMHRGNRAGLAYSGNTVAFAQRYGDCLLHFVIDPSPKSGC